MIRVRVRYFAALKDQAGCEEEVVATDCASPGALYESLKTRRGLRMEPRHLRVAVNDRFESMDAALKSGDDVIFLPPVAGG